LIKGLSGRVIIRAYKGGSSVKITDGAGREIDHATTDSNGLCSLILKPSSNASYFIRVDGDSTKTPLPRVEENGCSLQLTPARNKDPIKIMVTSPPGSALRKEELILIVSSRGKIYHSSSFIQGSRRAASGICAGQEYGAPRSGTCADLSSHVQWNGWCGSGRTGPRKHAASAFETISRRARNDRRNPRDEHRCACRLTSA